MVNPVSDVGHEAEDSRTPRTLIELARAGDEAAWRRLVELYGPLVLLWCKRGRLGLSDDEAEEISCEVILTVFQNLDKWRSDRPTDTFRGWLRTITKRKVMDYLRKRKENRAVTGGSTHHDQLQQLVDPESLSDEHLGQISQERRLLFQRAVQLIQHDFPQHYFEIFWKVIVENRARNEMAQIYDMRIDTVHQVISRVKRRVREVYGDVLDLSDS